MTDDTPAVSVRDLAKIYGNMTALDGVTFDISRGETFAQLGPNVAGKSTTIEILEGYRDRSGGEAGADLDAAAPGGAVAGCAAPSGHRAATPETG